MYTNLYSLDWSEDNEWIGLCLSESEACTDTLTDTQASNQVENKSVLSIVMLQCYIPCNSNILQQPDSYQYKLLSILCKNIFPKVEMVWNI